MNLKQQQQQKNYNKVSKDNNTDLINSPASTTTKKSEFIIFPHTKVIAIAPEYSFTFLINFSSSMSSIDTSINKSLITEAIEM